MGEASVSGSTSVELLGVAFNRALRPTPYLSSQLTAAKRLLGVTKRLLRHLPAHLVAKISAALFIGKLGYGLAAAVPLRLVEEDPIHAGVQQIQVVVNTAARCILGKKLSDKISITQLLSSTGLPSINRLAVRSVALETWRAMVSETSSTPLADLLCCRRMDTRATRARDSGLLPPPCVPKNTLVWSAYRTWNYCSDLRSAKTL